ncbi:hypothetical protein DM01DRAFT_1338215 [Hesseltinella vesiculosa]|uniref:Uncharacterized protein n=1 Tax=Hesseltinella vesiculosa TaxID=101127 RepID=A0A1X2GCA7_9FUNG|nr:hypothetical protein DM01DRAFT_1338215 [Hesseltinella vesiculosa]
MIFLIPFLSRYEYKAGSLQVLYEFIGLYTVLPAFVYVAAIWVIDRLSVTLFLGREGCTGLSGWVMGLAVATSLQSDQSTQHSLFGVIPLPPKALPGLVLVFYTFLVPGTSLVLHLAVAAIAYLYHTQQWPRQLLPSQQLFDRLERNPWLTFLTSHPHYIKADHQYLPISTNDTSHGAGQRLGDGGA